MLRAVARAPIGSTPGGSESNGLEDSGLRDQLGLLAIPELPELAASLTDLARVRLARDEIYLFYRLDDLSPIRSEVSLRYFGVKEFDPAGKVVFELRDLDWPKDARRLPDGSTLIADKKGLHAFDAEGKKIQTLVTGEVTRFSRY